MPHELDATIQSALQQTFDEPLAGLRGELAARLSREFAAVQEQAASHATRAAKRATAQTLHVAVRRIRHASSIAEIGAALLETAASYCGRLELLCTLAGDQEDLLSLGYPGPLTEAIFT